MSTYRDNKGNVWDVPFFAGTIVHQRKQESASELRDAAFRNGWHD